MTKQDLQLISFSLSFSFSFSYRYLIVRWGMSFVLGVVGTDIL